MTATSARTPATLDDHDRAILQLLQADNRMPQRQIGEAVHLSAPAVQRRIARMEAEGIIRANMAVVDPVALGQPITILVEVTMASDRTDVVTTAKHRFRDTPQIQQCYCLAGVAGFMLIMTVASMSEYEAFSRQLLGDNEDVKSYRTIVVLDRVKADLQLDI